MKGIVIFIHGFAEGPNVFLPWVDIPEKYGWAKETLLLPGHGGSCHDFSSTPGREWFAKVETTIKHCAQNYDSIVLVGHSMGGLFSLLSSSLSEKVKAVIAISMPIAVRVKFRAVRTNLAVGLMKHVPEDHFAYGASQALSVGHGQPWEYLGWLPRLRDLFRYISQTRKALPSVTTPIWMFHGTKDELIGNKSVRLFKALAPTATSHCCILPNSSHFTYPESDSALVAQCLATLLSGRL